jgi:hypothetical protein
MSSSAFTHRRLTAAALACSALLVGLASSAHAAPSTDSRGFVDSTARCASADATESYGSTDSSRIAICTVDDGKYQYRGVRLRDGAKLIVPATRSADGAYLAVNDGIDYLVTSKSLVISVAEKVIREETWVDYHGPSSSAPAEPSTPATPLPPPLPAEVGHR